MSSEIPSSSIKETAFQSLMGKLEKAAPQIGTSGGRKYSYGDQFVSLHTLVTKCLSEIQPGSVSAGDLKTLEKKIRALDKEGVEALQKANFVPKILTYLRKISNIRFLFKSPVERAESGIRALTDQTNALIRDVVDAFSKPTLPSDIVKLCRQITSPQLFQKVVNKIIKYQPLEEHVRRVNLLSFYTPQQPECKQSIEREWTNLIQEINSKNLSPDKYQELTRQLIKDLPTDTCIQLFEKLSLSAPHDQPIQIAVGMTLAKLREDQTIQNVVDAFEKKRPPNELHKLCQKISNPEMYQDLIKKLVKDGPLEDRIRKLNMLSFYIPQSHEFRKLIPDQWTQLVKDLSSEILKNPSTSTERYKKLTGQLIKDLPLDTCIDLFTQLSLSADKQIALTFGSTLVELTKEKEEADKLIADLSTAKTADEMSEIIKTHSFNDAQKPRIGAYVVKSLFNERAMQAFSSKEKTSFRENLLDNQWSIAYFNAISDTLGQGVVINTISPRYKEMIRDHFFSISKAWIEEFQKNQSPDLLVLFNAHICKYYNMVQGFDPQFSENSSFGPIREQFENLYNNLFLNKSSITQTLQFTPIFEKDPLQMTDTTHPQATEINAWLRSLPEAAITVLDLSRSLSNGVTIGTGENKKTITASEIKEKLTNPPKIDMDLKIVLCWSLYKELVSYLSGKVETPEETANKLLAISTQKNVLSYDFFPATGELSGHVLAQTDTIDKNVAIFFDEETKIPHIQEEASYGEVITAPPADEIPFAKQFRVVNNLSLDPKTYTVTEEISSTPLTKEQICQNLFIKKMLEEPPPTKETMKKFTDQFSLNEEQKKKIGAAVTDAIFIPSMNRLFNLGSQPLEKQVEAIQEFMLRYNSIVENLDKEYILSQINKESLFKHFTEIVSLWAKEYEKNTAEDLFENTETTLVPYKGLIEGFAPGRDITKIPGWDPIQKTLDQAAEKLFSEKHSFTQTIPFNPTAPAVSVPLDLPNQEEIKNWLALTPEAEQVIKDIPRHLSPVNTVTIGNNVLKKDPSWKKSVDEIKGNDPRDLLLAYKLFNRVSSYLDTEKVANPKQAAAHLINLSTQTFRYPFRSFGTLYDMTSKSRETNSYLLPKDEATYKFLYDKETSSPYLEIISTLTETSGPVIKREHLVTEKIRMQEDGKTFSVETTIMPKPTVSDTSQ